VGVDAAQDLHVEEVGETEVIHVVGAAGDEPRILLALEGLA
jgi:hypothetical protein